MRIRFSKKIMYLITAVPQKPQELDPEPSLETFAFYLPHLHHCNLLDQNPQESG
jgi:hypothetical protein